MVTVTVHLFSHSEDGALTSVKHKKEKFFDQISGASVVDELLWCIFRCESTSWIH